MSLFDKLVPHTWTPNSDFLMDVLMVINSRSAVQYIGKIYDDMELLQWGEARKVRSDNYLIIHVQLLSFF